MPLHETDTDIRGSACPVLLSMADIVRGKGVSGILRLSIASGEQTMTLEDMASMTNQTGKARDLRMNVLLGSAQYIHAPIKSNLDPTSLEVS